MFKFRPGILTCCFCGSSAFFPLGWEGRAGRVEPQWPRLLLFPSLA